MIGAIGASGPRAGGRSAQRGDVRAAGGEAARSCSRAARSWSRKRACWCAARGLVKRWLIDPHCAFCGGLSNERGRGAAGGDRGRAERGRGAQRGVSTGRRRARPFLMSTLDASTETDWSHKSGSGREVLVAMTLWDDQPVRLHALADAVEAAMDASRRDRGLAAGDAAADAAARSFATSPGRGPRRSIIGRGCWRSTELILSTQREGDQDMAAERGSAFLLKIGDGAATPGLRDGGGAEDDAIVGQRRCGGDHQQGQRRLARVAVGRRRPFGIGGGERDLHRQRGRSAGARAGADRRRSRITS